MVKEISELEKWISWHDDIFAQRQEKLRFIFTMIDANPGSLKGSGNWPKI